MKRFVYLSVIGILITASLAYVFSQRIPESFGAATTQAASKTGSIGASPYVGADYNKRPLVVIGVATNKERHAVEKIGLINISNKVAVAVKIGWFVSLTQKTGDVVEEGETELITFSEHLRPGGQLDLNRRLVGLVDIANTLKQKGAFDSAYTIQVAATEIVFNDGTGWPDKKGTNESAGPRRLDYSHASATVRYPAGLVVTPLATMDCVGNGMQCVWVDGGPLPGHYSCESAGNPHMFCDVYCTTSCCSYLCGPYEPWCGPCY